MNFDNQNPHHQDVTLHWRGWSATPHSLQSAGWDIETHRNIHECSTTTRMRWRERRVHVYKQGPLSAIYSDALLASNIDYYTDPGIFFAFKLSEGHTKYNYGHDRANSLPINIHDAYRQYYTTKTPPLVIPKDDSVGDLLARIQDMQEDARIQRIRDDIKKERLILPSYNIVQLNRMD